jgi:hypothetical protein
LHLPVPARPASDPSPLRRAAWLICGIGKRQRSFGTNDQGLRRVETVPMSSPETMALVEQSEVPVFPRNYRVDPAL